MRTDTRLVVLLFLTFTAVGCASKDTAKEQRLQGLWIEHERFTSGKPDPKGFPEYLVITQDKLQLYRIAHGELFEYRSFDIALDTTHTPHRLDLFVIEDGNRVKRTNIFKFDGDKLTICYDPNNESYPMTFDSAEDYGRSLVTFRRVENQENEIDRHVE